MIFFIRKQESDEVLIWTFLGDIRVIRVAGWLEYNKVGINLLIKCYIGREINSEFSLGIKMPNFFDYSKILEI